MEVIKSERGGSKLCYEGYMYTKKGTNKTTLRRECSSRRGFDCLGAAVTDLQVRSGLQLFICYLFKPEYTPICFTVCNKHQYIALYGMIQN